MAHRPSSSKSGPSEMQGIKQLSGGAPLGREPIEEPLWGKGGLVWCGLKVVTEEGYV